MFASVLMMPVLDRVSGIIGLIIGIGFLVAQGLYIAPHLKSDEPSA